MEEVSENIVENIAASSSTATLQLDELNSRNFEVNQPLSLDSGKRQLHNAAAEGDVHMVQRLLYRGAEVDVRDYDGNTALHGAAREGHIDVIRLLLDGESDPNAVNDEGRTILQNAVCSENLDTTRLLLSRGADLKAHISKDSFQPNVQTQPLDKWYTMQDKTVLTLAFQLDNLDLIGVLLEAGANVEVESNLLTYIAIRKNSIELVKLLIVKGASFYVKCIGEYKGKTSFNFAICCGCYDIVKVLLTKGGGEEWFSSRSTTREGKESLRLAYVNGHLNIARLLIEKGMYLNDKLLDFTLQNVLMTNHVAVAEWLFNHGANLHVPDYWYYDFLYTAITKGHFEMVQLFLNTNIVIHLEKDKCSKLLVLATQNKFVPIIEPLLQRGADLKFVDYDGNTALYYAIKKYDSTNVFEIFLKFEALVDDILNTKSGTTALHLAIELRNKELFELLLTKGANVNVKDADGNTPCHLLFKYGFDAKNICFAKPLVEKGADIFCFNCKYEMPIDLAIKEKSLFYSRKDLDDRLKLLLEECYKVTEENEPFFELLLCKVITKGFISLARVVLNKIVELYYLKALVTCFVTDSSVTNNESDETFFEDDEDGINYTNLYRAAYQNDITLLNIALQSGVCIDAPTKDRFTPLQVALYRGNVEIAQNLIRNGANVTIEDKFGFLAIHLAFLLGDLSLLQLLLQQTCLNMSNVKSIPLLHIAAYHGSIDLVNVLLSTGFDINTMDSEKNTILHIAVKNQDSQLVDFLLESRIRKSVKNKFGDTAFHLALKVPTHFNTPAFDIAHSLLKQRIDINAANHEKNTPLHLAAASPLAKMLLEKGVKDVNAKNASGQTPLHRLASQWFLQTENVSLTLTDQVVLFLKHGADISVRSNLESLLSRLLMDFKMDIKKLEQECKANFTSILTYDEITNVFFGIGCNDENHQAKERLLDLLQILLNHGFTLNIEENNLDQYWFNVCFSLFEEIMEEKNFDMFQLILDRDEKLDVKALLSRTVNKCKWKCVKITLDKIVVRLDDHNLANLFFADSGKKHGLAQIVFDRLKVEDCLNIKCALLVQLARAGNIAQVKILLDKGFHINSVDDEGNTALHYAVVSSNKKMFRLLLDRGADVNTLNVRNETPTHIAAKEGNVEIFTMLIAKGAIVSTRDVNDNTLLHKTKSYVIAQILLDKGVPVKARNSDGRTALHCITDLESPSSSQTDQITDLPEVAALLVEKDAVINVQDRNGTTPLHLAAKNNHINMVKLLVNRGAKLYWTDKNGRNALHYAALHPTPSEMVQYLLNQGTPNYVKDKDGKTPYSMLLSLHSSFAKTVYGTLLLKQRLAGLPSDCNIAMGWSRITEASGEKELDEMKLIRIQDTFVLFDVFARFQKPEYLFDRNIVRPIETLLSSNLMDQFPQFREILKSCFNQSKHSRLYLTPQAIDSMFCRDRHEFCQTLPEDVWLHLFTFLSVEDLENIIESRTN